MQPAAGLAIKVQYQGWKCGSEVEPQALGSMLALQQEKVTVLHTAATPVASAVLMVGCLPSAFRGPGTIYPVATFLELTPGV